MCVCVCGPVCVCECARAHVFVCRHVCTSLNFLEKKVYTACLLGRVPACVVCVCVCVCVRERERERERERGAERGWREEIMEFIHVCLSVCPYASLSVHHSDHLSVCPSVLLPAHLSICLSVLCQDTFLTSIGLAATGPTVAEVLLPLMNDTTVLFFECKYVFLYTQLIQLGWLLQAPPSRRS
jgi:hypothetical protein